MIHGRHRIYHTDRLASLAVSVVWMLRYTAAPAPHRGSILDLETGRTTAVLCKFHEATPSKHIARCPKRPKRSTQHAGIQTTGTGIRYSPRRYCSADSRALPSLPIAGNTDTRSSLQCQRWQVKLWITTFQGLIHFSFTSFTSYGCFERPWRPTPRPSGPTCSAAWISRSWSTDGSRCP